MAARSYGERWTAAFGLQSELRSELLAGYRMRYERLKEQVVFKIDTTGSADPLTAFAEQDELHSTGTGSQTVHSTGDTAANGEVEGGWTQYFSDESLLSDINTDLERLHPTGKEAMFQNEELLTVMRDVLFVWCKLHPDVSYRQGMHDVVAVVMYAFLTTPPGNPADPTKSKLSQEGDATSYIPESIEADVFMVVEAVMLYLKPFYEVVAVPSPSRQHVGVEECSSKEDFVNSVSDEAATTRSSATSTASSASHISQRPANDRRPHKLALHRLCEHIQCELLQQKDPRLCDHLRNADIVPETYCLRWIRLLLAREFLLDDLLIVWDAMIMDSRRDPIAFPETDHLSTETHFVSLPEVKRTSAESRWMGFPLLRYLSVAKLLELSPRLCKEDNTGCLQLLMHSGSGGVEIENEDEVGSVSMERMAKTLSLVNFARILQDPLLEEEFCVRWTDVNGDNELIGDVEVAEFQGDSLGIVLTVARAPYQNRLAVKNFVEDSSFPDGIGPAERSGKVRIGDLLQSINGVPIVGVTTEEAKHRIQSVGRPLFIGFLHPKRMVAKPTRRSVNFVSYRA